jgi:hypothetical protein
MPPGNCESLVAALEVGPLLLTLSLQFDARLAPSQELGRRTMAEPSDLVITLASPFAAATILVLTLADPIERPRVRGAKPRAEWKLLV